MRATAKANLRVRKTGPDAAVQLDTLHEIAGQRQRSRLVLNTNRPLQKKLLREDNMKSKSWNVVEHSS
jgi:hypothetical protein